MLCYWIEIIPLSTITFLQWLWCLLDTILFLLFVLFIPITMKTLYPPYPLVTINGKGLATPKPQVTALSFPVSLRTHLRMWVLPQLSTSCVLSVSYWALTDRTLLSSLTWMWLLGWSKDFLAMPFVLEYTPKEIKVWINWGTIRVNEMPGSLCRPWQQAARWLSCSTINIFWTTQCVWGPTKDFVMRMCVPSLFTGTNTRSDQASHRIASQPAEKNTSVEKTTTCSSCFPLKLSILEFTFMCWFVFHFMACHLLLFNFIF